MTDTPDRQPQTAIEYLKAHFEWKQEMQHNQLFDASGVLEAIKEAEVRATHTSPPAPAKKEYELTEDIAFIRSKTMNCKGCESNTCAEVCQQWQKEHDAQVAKAERERVLDAMQAGETIGDYLWSKAESLRGAQEEQGGVSE